MKKIAISTLAVLIACPAFANGTMNSGSSYQPWGYDMYVGVRGGAGYTSLNNNYNGSGKTVSDTVMQGRVAAGLELCKTVRSEVEWSIYGKAKDKDTFGDAGRVNVKTNLQTVMWNSYMEYGGYKIVRPFAGLGIGAAFTKISTNGDNDRSTDFTAMGSVGVTFDMERYAVDIAARYNYVDVESGLHNFGGDIGIRFMF